MKKTLLLAAALACSGTVAQEKEIWACQEVQSNGMDWINGRWQGGQFQKSQLLFTLNGINSTLKLPELPKPVDLSCLYDITDGYWFCSDPFLARSFIINQGSGSAGYSALFGAVSSAQDKSSIYVSALQCTKF